MLGIATEFLFTISLDVPVLALGETPYGADASRGLGAVASKGRSFEASCSRGVAAG
jgi:hypothetical protein